jgi:hypothetical protein
LSRLRGSTYPEPCGPRLAGSEVASEETVTSTRYRYSLLLLISLTAEGQKISILSITGFASGEERFSPGGLAEVWYQGPTLMGPQDKVRIEVNGQTVPVHSGLWGGRLTILLPSDAPQPEFEIPHDRCGPDPGDSVGEAHAERERSPASRDTTRNHNPAVNTRSLIDRHFESLPGRQAHAMQHASRQQRC